MKNGIFTEGDKICWYKDNVYHREDGPAIEYWLGDLISEDDLSNYGSTNKEFKNKNQWFVEGKELTEEEFNLWKMKNDLNKKLHKNLKEKKKIKRPKI